MIADIVTIMWKEWREMLLQRGSLRGTIVNMLLMIAVFAVFLPLQSGRAWIESPIAMAAWVWLPLLLVSSMVADSFAGERERHTLETLLASRLSDRAILLGKVASSISYALTMTLVLMVAAAITVNVAFWSGHVLFYPPATVVGVLIIGILGAGLVADLGVLLSLRAATVRQAAQALSLGILALIWIPMLVTTVVPAQMQERVVSSLMALDLRVLASLAVVILLTLDVLLLAAAMVRFQRSKLILD